MKGFGFKRHLVILASCLLLMGTIVPVASLAKSAIRLRSGITCKTNSLCGTLHFPLVPDSSLATSSYQNGYSPQQVKGAYTLNSSLTGAGITIAIVDPNDDPNAQSDFDTFSMQFSLPTVAGGCNCFTKVNQTGGTQYPPPNAAAAIETSLDIEWAHAIAPNAHILLVEANSGNQSDIYTAEDYATAHAKVVSDSWGYPEYSSETNDDVHFNKPVAIVVAAGDNGSLPSYPSTSPYVLSVGGTKLTINGTTTGGGCVSSGCTYGGETVSNNNTKLAGGGGVSAYEPQPAYQNSFCGSVTNVNNCGGKRGTPDVAWDADQTTAVAVYDSYNNGGWITQGGTSLGAPSIAGVIALIDQAYNITVTTNNLSTRFAYQNDAATTTYSSNYHDLQSGSNALPNQTCCTAGSGWDLANGLGSPNGNNWIALARSWSAVSSPSPASGGNELASVAAISASNAWAVGYKYGNAFGSTPYTLIEHWNGTKWVVVSSPNPSSFWNELDGIAVVSSSNIWTVGHYSAQAANGGEIDRTLIEKWNGTKWVVISSPNASSAGNDLLGVAAISATNIWAVGYYFDSSGTEHPLIEHWNGTKWVVVSSPTRSGGALDGVAAVSASNIWAVGSYFATSNTSYTLIEQWNGTTWKVIPSPSPEPTGTNELNAVVAVGTSNIWAVGDDYSGTGSVQPLTEQWNGTSWNVISSPNPSGGNVVLRAVAAISANNIWAVGQNAQNTLIEQWNGTSWSVVSSPNPGSGYDILFGVARVPGIYQLWATGQINLGSQTLVEHYS